MFSFHNLFLYDFVVSSVDVAKCQLLNSKVASESSSNWLFFPVKLGRFDWQINWAFSFTLYMILYPIACTFSAVILWQGRNKY